MGASFGGAVILALLKRDETWLWFWALGVVAVVLNTHVERPAQLRGALAGELRCVTGPL
jgi:hypothetical protein